ncbi:LysR substrate-binding domain-containing protein [Burkholderia multivorans]|uniref:LysR substrate-binding domain-containing protein n=1 Tax=Burkholderia multivorans TaxID=87883 RepID=UPI002018D041|nr:LysR substrate-binding domain-containing protein [Burkholderia multivorans]MCL4648448.1 LysR substrate-binding domain-containing protein [Burkholderia multivorans]MCL4657304.1 LysR substrate-binding domain-containing protein [Burkholderia multivorans]MCO1423234.1 LysR substrate-binding domain-containing protein [Burkholderia multivorans]UQN54275.1 LysR substrate-binding domain-containing protein [Burkholderia multivorans]UQN80797.1 LysR substrate-binding domain-containing protein [Burkholde
MAKSIPLAALHTFVEVARCGSMKQAADLLCLSPGAVSQHVRHLEDRLAVRLFERNGRELELTGTGRALFDALAGGFREIESAWANLHGANRRVVRLTVTTTASFANSWLVQRLGAFNAHYPEIEITIDTRPQLVDLRRDYVDIAIRHGLGRYPGHASFRIWTPELWPVCSPQLLDRARPIAQPADCLAYPLLQDADRADWVLWLRAQGIEDPRAQRGASFSDDALLIKAAVASQGIALVRDIYARDEIAAGRLVRVLVRPWPTELSYYVVCNEARRDEWKIVAFRDWLAREIGDGAGEPAGRDTRDTLAP